MASPSPWCALPAVALLANAFVWGTSWWAFRRLEAAGLHPLWTTAFIFAVAAALLAALRPSALRQLAATPALWIVVVASGTTNAAFNWAVVIGDVVRVVLLFYLMPLWTVLLARLVLGERLPAAAAFRIALGLVGAAVVLWPQGDALRAAGTAPLSLADALGLVGGFSFAVNNVMLRRLATSAEAGRSLAMFSGGTLVAATLAALLSATGALAWPPPPSLGWLPLALALTLLFIGGNLALQYGAARLPANTTAVVMLTEVVFASASAILLGAGSFGLRPALGGGLIVASALLAAFDRSSVAKPVPAALPS